MWFNDKHNPGDTDNNKAGPRATWQLSIPMGPVIICDDLQRHTMSGPDPPEEPQRACRRHSSHGYFTLRRNKWALTSRSNFHTSVTLTLIDCWAGLGLMRVGFWIKRSYSDGSAFVQRIIDGWTVTGFPPHASVNSSITSPLCAHQKAPTDFCRLTLISFTAPNLTLQPNLTGTLITHSSCRYVYTLSDAGLC